MLRCFGTSAQLAAILLPALVVRIAFACVYIHAHPARAPGTIPFLFEPGNIAFSIVNGTIAVSEEDAISIEVPESATPVKGYLHLTCSGVSVHPHN